MADDSCKLYEAGKLREGFVDMMRDSGFKAVLVDRNNKNLLIRMLNCILPQETHITDILSYRDREQSVDYVGAKKTFLDLVCVGDTGDTFNVEVQQKVDGSFFQRCVYDGWRYDQLPEESSVKNLKKLLNSRNCELKVCLLTDEVLPLQFIQGNGKFDRKYFSMEILFPQ